MTTNLLSVIEQQHKALEFAASALTVDSAGKLANPYKRMPALMAMDAALAAGKQALEKTRVETKRLFPKPKCLTCRCWSIDKDSNCDYCGAPYVEPPHPQASEPALADHPDVRELRKWLNEGQTAEIDRMALARVLAMFSREPAPSPDALSSNPAEKHSESSSLGSGAAPSTAGEVDYAWKVKSEPDQPAQGELPPFNDPRVQIAYEILVDDERPPEGEHWEGFLARKIVAALLSAPTLPESDHNAPWLTKAHMLCSDHGVQQGNIEWRLEVLRGLFAETKGAGAVGELTDEQIDKVWLLNGGGLAANRYYDFARAILAAARTQPERVPMTDDDKRKLVRSYFAEDWAQDAAYGMLADYEKLEATSTQPAMKPLTEPVIRCPEKLKKGGCQLHNLHCGWPKCNEGGAA